MYQTAPQAGVGAFAQECSAPARAVAVGAFSANAPSTMGLQLRLAALRRPTDAMVDTPKTFGVGHGRRCSPGDTASLPPVL